MPVIAAAANPPRIKVLLTARPPRTGEPLLASLLKLRRRFLMVPECLGTR